MASSVGSVRRLSIRNSGRAGERIAAAGKWVVVWRDGSPLNGTELVLSGIALDRQKDDTSGDFGLRDGSAGLLGSLIKSDNYQEVKMFASRFLAGGGDGLGEANRGAGGRHATRPAKHRAGPAQRGVEGLPGDLNTRLGHAIAQLHSVEKIIHTFEQRQMRTRSGAETLQLFYAEFYEGSHMVCWI